MATNLPVAIYTYLAAQAGIASAVSTRVYPRGETPQRTTYPYITFQRVSSTGHHHMLAAEALGQQRYQFDCWATTALSAETVAEALRAELDGFRRGLMGTVTIMAVHLVDRSDEAIPPTDGSDRSKFRVRQDYMFWHAQDVPTF
jgi:hypothetical protein